MSKHTEDKNLLRCAQLKYLDLSDNRRITLTDPRLQTNGILERLEYLDIGNDSVVTEEALAFCKNLVCLRVGNRFDITLQRISLTFMRKLKYLWVGGCRRVDDASLSNCHELVELGARDCTA